MSKIKIQAEIDYHDAISEICKADRFDKWNAVTALLNSFTAQEINEFSNKNRATISKYLEIKSERFK